MEPAITIRSYEDGDEHGIVELLELVFQGWPHLNLSCSSLDYWIWKYSDHPYGKKKFAVAVADDKIIGSNLGITYNAFFRGKPYLVYQAYDLAVHPDYRRHGVWTKMNDYLLILSKEFPVNTIIGITVNPIVFEGLLKREGILPFPNKVNTLLRIKDVNLHFKMRGMEDETLKKIGVKMLKGVTRLTSGYPRRDARKDYSLYEVNVFDDSYSVFWMKVMGSYDFILDRSVEFMNWRYLDPRAGDFKVISAKKGSEWLGYVIYNVNTWNREYPETIIVDLLTLPGRSDVASDLIDEVGRRSDAEGVNAVYSWAVENSQYSRDLEKRGYLNTKNIPYIVYDISNLGEDKDVFQKINTDKLVLNYGDTDWI